MKNNFREKSHLKYKKLYLLSTERVKKRYSFSRIIGKDSVFYVYFVSDELQLFAQEIQCYLSPNILRNLARESGFVQRTCKFQTKVYSIYEYVWKKKEIQ